MSYLVKKLFAFDIITMYNNVMCEGIEVTKEELLDKIEEFKDAGCVLFQ